MTRTVDKDGYPRSCWFCRGPVLVKENARMHTDVATGRKFTAHTACIPPGEWPPSSQPDTIKI